MFGGNWLTEHLDDRNKSRQDAKKLNARLHLVMSDAGDTSFAQDLKQDNPEATVVFRPYHKDDPRWQDTTMTAEQVWEEHRRFAVGGLAVAVWNEPGFSPALMAMVTQVAAFARRDGKQAALPSPGVGNFGEGDISSGGLDKFLIELAADKRVMGSANPPNLLAAHEYAQQSTLAEQPYRIGRVKWMLDRALKIGAPISANRVAILEYGRDVGGDPAKDGGMTYFNKDQQKFFDFLTPGALLYLQLGLLGAALFCAGSTWPSFDWQHADTLISLMAAWNMAHPIIPPKAYAPGTNPLTMRVKLSAGIRLRTLPSINAPTIRSLPTNEQVTVFQNPVETADNFPWGRVNTSRGEAGWSALIVDGVPSFTTVGVPTPVPVPAPAPIPGVFRLASPVNAPMVITQHFGDNTTGVPDYYTRWGLPAHEGTDIRGKKGDPVYAAAYGQVKAINIPGQNGVVIDHAYGIHIKIAHVGADGHTYETDYCHLDSVAPGLALRQDVALGQRIGSVGMTGDANGVAHLHFMLRKAGASAAGELQTLRNGKKAVYKNDIVNPEPYLSPT